MKQDVIYDKKWLVWSLVGLFLLCGAMKVTNGVGYILIFLVMLVGFCRNNSVLLFFSLWSTATVTICNGHIVTTGPAFSVLARLTYILVGIVLSFQIIGQRQSRNLTPLLGIFVYLIYMIFVSSIGWNFLISSLKLFLFTIVFLAFYSGAIASVNAPTNRICQLRSVMLCFSIFLILGSALLVPFPSISKMGAEKAIAAGMDLSAIGLFQGVTNQPQCLGPLIAVSSVFLFADYVFSIKRKVWLYLLLLALSPVLLYYTSSRTAMGTWVAGMSFTICVFFNTNVKHIGVVWKRRVLSVVTIIGIIVGVAFFTTPQMRQGVRNFIIKYQNTSEQQLNFEEVIKSRQKLIDNAKENFAKSPIFGNGFQVADYHEELKITSWRQLLTAPIEKGVWIYAVPEEGGVLGMILFCGFLLVAFWKMLKRKSYIGVCLLFTFLVGNMGEFGFFAMSNWGGLVWGMIFAGLVFDADRVRREYMSQTLLINPCYSQRG